MPKLSWVQNILAGAIFRPLDGWQYQYVPVGGMISVLHGADVVGLVVTVTSGSDTLQERSPVASGVAVGVIPSIFDVAPLIDEVAAGDLIKIQYENTTVGAIDVSGEIDYTPA